MRLGKVTEVSLASIKILLASYFGGNGAIGKTERKIQGSEKNLKIET